MAAIDYRVAGTANVPTRGFAEMWDSTIVYSPRLVVLDRGALWRCISPNFNSRPGSGNLAWSLAAGVPFVRVTLTPPELTTAPYFSSPAAAPGRIVIPAPGVGLAALPVSPLITVVTEGNPWGTQALAKLYWIDPTKTAIIGMGGTPIPDALNTNLATQSRGRSLIDTIGIPAAWTLPPVLDNAPVVLHTLNDITSGGTVIGSRSITYFIRYQLIETAAQASTPTFFQITALNQGTKVFTVTPNPVALVTIGSSLRGVGPNAANNIAYTVADVTPTTIKVNEAIPSPTASGWLSLPQP
jgi:hypothetical protein